MKLRYIPDSINGAIYLFRPVLLLGSNTLFSLLPFQSCLVLLQIFRYNDVLRYL